MTISIEPKDLEAPPTKIGMLENRPVYQAKTKGGYHLIFTHKSGSTSPEFLAAGNHRAVARHVAAKKNENLVFTELSKSEHVNIEHYSYLIPECEELTTRIRKMNGDE